jgi:hypothetical protein
LYFAGSLLLGGGGGGVLKGTRGNHNYESNGASFTLIIWSQKTLGNTQP